MRVPDALARTVHDLLGAEADAWLSELPARVRRLAERWGVSLEAPFDAAYNFVAPGRRTDGLPVVLKVGPCPDLAREVEALRLFAGRGAVQVLEYAPHENAALLERVMPGTPLSGLSLADDEAATRIAAGVMRGLNVPPPADTSFPNVAQWGEGFRRLRKRFNGGTGPLPAHLVSRAEGLFTDLLASSVPPVLLHGDLHHYNILDAGGGEWLAIDPKGVLGEPAYEVGAFLRNPVHHLHLFADPAATLRRRAEVFSEVLELDPARVRGWGFAQAVLSAWWSVEDHGAGWEHAVQCAVWLE